MFGLPLNIILIAGLAALCVMLITVAIFLPKLSSEKRSGERLKTIGANTTNRASRSDGKNRQNEAAKRRKNLQEALKEIDNKNTKSEKVSLNQRLEQAGLKMSKATFFMMSGGLGVMFALVSLLFGAPLPVAGGLLVAGGLGLPRFILNFRKKRRIKAFTDELPDAVDIIVRGIKAGLPLNDGMRLVAAEAKDPLASEFRAVVEAQQLGIPMAEAVQKLNENIPTPEASFFATVIAIQQSSGGSLSEALGNLSKILRDRKKMRAKVKAISSEAKASAGIIGSLPIFVACIVYFISPGYMDLLFDTTTGNIVLACGGLLMGTGVLVMRNMINFDI